VHDSLLCGVIPCTLRYQAQTSQAAIHHFHLCARFGKGARSDRLLTLSPGFWMGYRVSACRVDPTVSACFHKSNQPAVCWGLGRTASACSASSNESSCLSGRAGVGAPARTHSNAGTCSKRGCELGFGSNCLRIRSTSSHLVVTVLVITLLLGRLPAPRSLPTPHSEGSRVTGLGRFGVELCRDRHCVTGPEAR